MSKARFPPFGAGAILRHNGSGEAYIVVSDGLINGEAVAVRYVHVTNPVEWTVVHAGALENPSERIVRANNVLPCPFCGHLPLVVIAGKGAAAICADDRCPGGLCLADVSEWNRRP